MFFFFNDTATTEIYTLSLHDALPISSALQCGTPNTAKIASPIYFSTVPPHAKICAVIRSDRKSTRLNSSHTVISYAVFCLKKKKTSGHIRATHSEPLISLPHSSESMQ